MKSSKPFISLVSTSFLGLGMLVFPLRRLVEMLFCSTCVQYVYSDTYADSVYEYNRHINLCNNNTQQQSFT